MLVGGFLTLVMMVREKIALWSNPLEHYRHFKTHRKE
jgi:hypothetical protein